MSLSEKNSIRMVNSKINTQSIVMEKKLCITINKIFNFLVKKYDKCTFIYEKNININNIVDIMPNKHVEYHTFLKTSRMSPDGGIIYLIDKKNKKYPLLISEAKTQGTNDKRIIEGKKQQSMGNAIERLGKNVIGFRALLNDEEIFPFICFADGCDFFDGSYIVDRVSVIFYFSKLNTVNLYNYKNLAYGSFFYRIQKWEEKQMYPILSEIAEKSINFYFLKYGKNNFLV
jgi:type II restriction enzyme